MPWYAFLLYPFALLYELITSLRNCLFDVGWKRSSKSPLPTIIIGNLSVGGTGKTPMVEYLISMLKEKYMVGTLSRGYGRKTKGFLRAGQTSHPGEIGDEPFQVFQKYGDQIAVFVGEDRVAAMKNIIRQNPLPEVMLLDDAFQHRAIQGDLTILLTTYQKPFFEDYLLPAGRLRENRKGARRADLLVVTKCPLGITSAEKNRFRTKASFYSKRDCPVIFSSIHYGKVYGLTTKTMKRFSPNIILLSGLANDALLVGYVKENYNVVDTLKYPDHHDYSASDFDRISNCYSQFISQNPVILTTEKDAVKVKSNAPNDFLKEIPIFVLPIEVKIASEDREVLEKLIFQKVFQKDIY